MVIVHTFLLCSFVFVVKFILHEVRMNVFIFLLPVALESIIHHSQKNGTASGLCHSFFVSVLIDGEGLLLQIRVQPDPVFALLPTDGEKGTVSLHGDLGVR